MKNEELEISYFNKKIKPICSEEEAVEIWYTAQKYGFSFIKNEIFFKRDGNKNIICASRDGFLGYANNHPKFSGMISDVVYADDQFVRENNEIKHRYGSQRRKIVGAYTLIKRDDFELPTYYFASFDQYAPEANKFWEENGPSMIQKIAEAIAIKKAFNISKVYLVNEIFQQTETTYLNTSNVKVENADRLKTLREIVVNNEDLRQLAIQEFKSLNIFEDDLNLSTIIYSLTDNQFLDVIDKLDELRVNKAA